MTPFLQLLQGLNSEQLKAVYHFDGPLLILAGAGTGKTRTITYRVAYLILERQVKASSILAVTFTNKATQEMKERLEHLVPKSSLSGITVSTFHSLCMTLLKESIHHLGYRPQFAIYDTSDQLALIGEALRYFHGTKEGNYDRKVVLSRISWLKNQGLDEVSWRESSYYNHEDPYNEALEFSYQFYQEKMRFYNALDFDDILFLTVKLLELKSELAESYSARFRYILVDEYQDTNPLQLRLLKALTVTHHNICVVGDDDQAIYGFRGADIQNILDFEESFPGTQVIRLEENYRSTQPILRLSNEVIKENKRRKGKTLWSCHTSTFLPQLLACHSTEQEAQTVVSRIKELLISQIDPKEIAIIYRSNVQAPPFEELLRMEGIPYKMIGGQKFYEKKEVKDVVAYLSLLQNPYDEVSLRRILNVPPRGIGPQTLELFLQKSQEEKRALLDVMFSESALAGNREAHLNEFKLLLGELRRVFREKSLPEAISYLIDRIKLPEYIEKCYKESKQVDRRKRDLEQLKITAERFLHYLEPGVPPLKAFLEKLFLSDQESDKDDEEGKEEERMIWLMTLHSAKGLEFNHVFLVGLEEELLPHKKCLSDASAIEEERRLCYVGVTRARTELVMTYCKKRHLYGQDRPREKSRFLHLPDDSIPFYDEHLLQELL